MNSAKNQFGKQQPKPAELGTEYRRTHDAKPKTRNTEPETSDPRRPNFPFVPSFQSRVLPYGKLGGSEGAKRTSQLPKPITFVRCISKGKNKVWFIKLIRFRYLNQTLLSKGFGQNHEVLR